jgi:hypothetical protein
LGEGVQELQEFRSCRSKDSPDLEIYMSVASPPAEMNWLLTSDSSHKRRSNYFVADLSCMRDHASFQDIVRQVEVKCTRAFVPEVFDECGHIV